MPFSCFSSCFERNVVDVAFKKNFLKTLSRTSFPISLAARHMASPGGGGGGGNSRRNQQHSQQQQHSQHSFEAPSPPRVPAVAAAQAQQQQHHQLDTNNPLATLAAQLPVLAADPYYGALIGTLPPAVRERLEREGGHHAGAATASADVVAAAREHYYSQAAAAAASNQQKGAAAAAAPQPQKPKDIIYINPKQYHRILVRREARARAVARGVGVPGTRGAYLHVSRHEAAVRRPRVGGKFLPKNALADGGGGSGGGGGGGGS